MRTTTWYYLRSVEGTFQGITARQIHAFQAGLDRLPTDAEGIVRYAQLYIHWENRRPATLFGSEFLKYQVGAEGLFQSAEWAAHLGQALRDCYLDLSAQPRTNLVDACHRFAERRYKQLTTWDPSSAEISALSALVRRRLQRAINQR